MSKFELILPLESLKRGLMDQSEGCKVNVGLGGRTSCFNGD
jgi:hypothetical protein